MMSCLIAVDFQSQSLFIQGWGTTKEGVHYVACIWSQSLFIQGWGTTKENTMYQYEDGCLNPFSFRAGVLHLARGSAENYLGLNPFSFRAGVLHKPCTKTTLRKTSQSLFIQGWGTTVWCHFLLCLQNVEIVIRGFLAS